MTDENNKAIDVLVDKILFAINRSMNELGCDKTFKTAILGKNTNGTYKINYLNQEYNIRNSLAVDELKVGQLVWVKIPSGVFRDMHVCGIVR